MRLRSLAGDELAALAVAVPAFADLLVVPTPPADRYVVHRAIRGLLERLAGTRGLVVCLDDLHWAGTGSFEALADRGVPGEAERDQDLADGRGLVNAVGGA